MEARRTESVCICVLLLASAAMAVEPGKARIEAVTVQPGHESSRVHIALSTPVEYSVTASSSDDCVMVFLPETGLPDTDPVIGRDDPFLVTVELRDVEDGVLVMLRPRPELTRYHGFASLDDGSIVVEVGGRAPSERLTVGPGGGEYVIAPQDLLSITVYEHRELSQKVRVSSEGMITFPLIGRVAVADLTAAEVERHLALLLDARYIVNPQVTVQVKEAADIYLLGEVVKPGLYKLRAGLTVVEAITMAGGFTKTAAPNKARLIRSQGIGKETVLVPLNEIIANVREDISLRAGDIVMIPETFF